MDKTIVIIATLDTKGHEAFYIRDKIQSQGIRALILDSATSDKDTAFQADIDKYAVAEASGHTVAQIAAMGRGEAIDAARVGLRKVIRDLYDRGELHGVFSMGGGDGALLASVAMQALPVGVPKMIVSPIAQGLERFGPYMGDSDINIMHSVIDILGINSISQKVFDNAVGAIVGMVRAEVNVELKPGKVIATTMYGNTTPAVMRAKTALEEHGYEVVVFHPNGTGGGAMEKMIRRGLFCGVLDMTTHEITDHLFGGLHAGSAQRLDAAVETGVPQVVVPGCIDFMIQGPRDSLPANYKRRKTYHFNPALSLVKTSHKEMAELGVYMAAKLNRAKGPTRFMIPAQGFSMYTRPGDALHDPKGNRVFINSLKKNLGPQVALDEIDCHINDPQFADATVEALLAMLGEASAQA